MKTYINKENELVVERGDIIIKSKTTYHITTRKTIKKDEITVRYFIDNQDVMYHCLSLGIKPIDMFCLYDEEKTIEYEYDRKDIPKLTYACKLYEGLNKGE